MNLFLVGLTCYIVFGLVGQRIEDRIQTGSWKRPWVWF